jgi:ribosomal-protein-alanine N-acetyltransferase
MNPPRIRLATAADAAWMSGLSRDLIETGLGWSYRPRRIAGLVSRAENCGIVALRGRHPAGFAVMEFLDEHAHLVLLAVEPRAQRRGLGRALVEWLEDSARAAGIPMVYCEARAASPAARGFYRALGYRELFLMPGYYRGVEAAVRLGHDVRRLAPETAG